MSEALGTHLRARVSCPHCWHKFPPEEVLWVSAHPDLNKDARLGEAAQRFLPTRFNPDGHAVDVKGMVCHQLACPNCHLSVPRVLLEIKPTFFSILGAPHSGKSYLLASMTWQMRKTLLHRFHLSFGDADPITNHVLIKYEEELFLNNDAEKLVELAKTEKEGDLYESVKFGEQNIWYPKPFVFGIHPLESHVNYRHRRRISRALCLYDNAGEHFLPGEESATHPGTQHLALSSVLMFLFDPTQHPKFRAACRETSSDPQLTRSEWVYRQDLIIQEAANRVRIKTGLPQDAKDMRPLIVVVTKYDIWKSMRAKIALPSREPVKRSRRSKFEFLDVAEIKEVSRIVRKLLLEFAPEVIIAAEGFSGNVTYIPVSALGRSPEEVGDSTRLLIRPRDIEPTWAEIPMLFALQQTTDGLLYSVEDIKQRAKAAPA